MTPLPSSRLLKRFSRKIVPNFTFRAAIICIVFALPFVLYLKTLCPTIYPGDGPELTAAAWCLGVPHPTGYPLFMVLGWVFTHLFPGTPAFSLNMLNAILGAAAAAGAYRLARELWRSIVGISAAGSVQFRIAAAAFALMMAASATWWDLSTSTDVFTLFFIFLTLGWAAALRLIRKPTRSGLWTLALISGFAFLNHQLYIITFPLAMVGVLRFVFRPEKSGKEETGEEESSNENHPVVESRSNFKRNVMPVMAAILIFIIPLLGYAYLPMRAATQPPINWGNPHGVEGILWHLTGKAYTGTRVLSRQSGERLELSEIPAHLAIRSANLARWIGEQYMPEDSERPWRGPIFTLLSILIGGMGLYCLWRKARWAALGLLLALLTNLVLVMIYTIADIEAYQVPLWIVLWLLVMVAIVEIGDLFPERYADSPRRHLRLRALAISIVSVAMAVLGIAGWYPEQGMVNKSNHWDAYYYAETLLNTVPPQSVIFTGGDYDLFPLWYAQVCEKKRLDVAVIGANFVLNGSGWYRAVLEATLPRGVKAFVANEPLGDKGRWMVAFLGGMVAPQIKAGRRVYLTMPYDPDIAKYYKLIPVFQLPSPFPPPAKLIAGRGLVKGSGGETLGASGSEVGLESRIENGTRSKAVLEQKSVLEPRPGPEPRMGAGVLYVFEVKDPENFSDRAMEQFERDFPENEGMWVVGQR